MVDATWKGQKAYDIRLGNGETVHVEADGPKSGDLVLAGLLACSGRTLSDILNRMRLDVEAIELSAEAEREEEPPNVFRLIRVSWTIRRGDAPFEKVRRAVDLAEKHCTILNTLMKAAPVDMKIVITPGDDA